MCEREKERESMDWALFSQLRGGTYSFLYYHAPTQIFLTLCECVCVSVCVCKCVSLSESVSLFLYQFFFESVEKKEQERLLLFMVRRETERLTPTFARTGELKELKLI